MWAYTNNRHLLGKTVQMLLSLAETKAAEMEPFDLSTSCWFASQLNLPTNLTNGLLMKLHARFVELCDQMEMLEIVKCLRWFVGRLSHVDQPTV